MQYDETLLNRISSFGVLGYSPSQIVDLLGPEEPQELKKDLLTPGSPAHQAYIKGKSTGRYSLDKSLFDKATKDKDIEANTRVFARIQNDKIDAKISENFGL